MNPFMASRNEGHVEIEDETIMFYGCYRSHFGYRFGGLPSKVNKVKKFADEGKMERNIKKFKEINN